MRQVARNLTDWETGFLLGKWFLIIDRMIFLGSASLDHAVAEYVAHYHAERSHQGLGNELISGALPQGHGEVHATARLGGLLKYYHRNAA